MPLTRREFTLLGASALCGSLPAAARPQQERKAPLSPEQVREFVMAGHGNLDRVKEMLDKEPGLLNATWDWGGGDFESALEGAGHVGHREIALYLIGKGARMSVFQAAMLGELELVQTAIRLHPAIKDSKGPHGITLIRHAEKGGEPAKEVLAYLKSLG